MNYLKDLIYDINYLTSYTKLIQRFIGYEPHN